MIRIALLLALLVSGVDPASAGDDPRLERSRAIVSDFQIELGGRLKAALESGGPAMAIQVCRSEATVLAARLSEATGAGVGRTSVRVRNPDNAPSAIEHEALQLLQQALAQGEQPPIEHFEADVDGGALYTRAIVTQPLCLMCRGENLAPEVTAALGRHYPDDRATGFEVGDLRGAFVVQWAPDANEQGD